MEFKTSYLAQLRKKHVLVSVELQDLMEEHERNIEDFSTEKLARMQVLLKLRTTLMVAIKKESGSKLEFF